MPLFDRDEKHSVGITEFDSQHQRLLALLNTLFDSMMKAKGTDVLSKTLDTLVESTQAHFRQEEAVLKLHSYPQFSLHKAEHEKLLLQAADLQRRTRAGARPSIETIQYLKSWLLDHIDKADGQYTDYLHQKGVR